MDTTFKNIGQIPEEWRYMGVEIPLEQTLNTLDRGAHIPLLDDWECRWPLLR